MDSSDRSPPDGHGCRKETSKGSNLIHKGFNDLLAMLPTGSGTGASTFFNSSHHHPADCEGEGGSRELPAVPAETAATTDERSQASVWFWGSMMGEAGQSGVSGSPDATEAKPNKVTVQPLLIPCRVGGKTVAVDESATRAEAALRELPDTPTTTATPVSGTPTTRQSPSPRVPVPGIFPLRPTVTPVRSPMSPPFSSVLSTPLSEKDIVSTARPARIQVGQTILEENARSPLATNQRSSPKAATKAARERKFMIPDGVLESPILKGKRVTRVSAVSPGKIDKRLISWPMDFRHVVHVSDPEEAQFLLMRWAIDGMGKVAGETIFIGMKETNEAKGLILRRCLDPGWANHMKLLVRQRAADQQARAIAQSMIAREHGARLSVAD
ncbi:hypothetical protein QFC19_004822 [Naganishia cerealis]|uniref:Uncharacterized protein n=1 Tax=Naganishia cerealis TaxID=610337 RepID=A0ACC2VT72_9TREE|nr:hypothetical protein QFC19_004822 [Naganishia cerealis]